MNILHLHPGPDTGGQSMAGKRVLEAGGDSVRVLVHSHHRFGYELAEKWETDADLQAAYQWADLVIVHNDPALYHRAATGNPKPVIVHHHGSRFRGNPERIYREAEAIGARQMVSTVDLLLSVPEGGHAEWMPQVVDLERMRTIRAKHYVKSHKPRVAHAPTNRQIKGTRFVTRAMRAMKSEVDYILIQRQTWATCLAYKAMADVFIDQLSLGYGNNAIEAWAMGIPVMSGAPPEIIDRMKREYGGGVPFFLTSAEALVEDVRLILSDPSFIEYHAARGAAHVEAYHAPEAWAERARRLYLGEPVEIAA